MSKKQKRSSLMNSGPEIITFGCRLNIVESEQISQNLTQSSNSKEDIAIFNTCTVTNEAEKQARQAIRKYHRQNPTKKIIVTGCAAQANPDQFVKMPEVAKILGNKEKMSVANYNNFSGRRVRVGDIMQKTPPQEVGQGNTPLLYNFTGKSRAFLQVQNGCDHRCTFCKIPYGRGNSSSMPLAMIWQQIQVHIDAGMQEIVLTGVDATSYGQDLQEQISFSQMIESILTKFPNLKRLRLSSIDVAEIDEKLVHLISTESRLMPHLHISLQAGDDTVLTRMKRRHNRHQVINFCHHIRSKRPEIAFGADIIAGFPTESNEMFLNTLNLITEAGLQYLHVFPYSPKDGTPAAKLPQIDKAIRLDRAKKLRAKGRQQMMAFFNKNLGTEREILIENNSKGYTDNFIPVLFDTELPVGSIAKARLTEILPEDGKMKAKLVT